MQLSNMEHLLRRKRRKTETIYTYYIRMYYTLLVARETWPLTSPYKGTVVRKAFPCHNGIIRSRLGIQVIIIAIMLIMMTMIVIDDLRPSSTAWKLNTVKHLDPRWYRPMLLNNVPSKASQGLICQTNVHLVFMKYGVFHHCINLQTKFYMDCCDCI